MCPCSCSPHIRNPCMPCTICATRTLAAEAEVIVARVSDRPPAGADHRALERQPKDIVVPRLLRRELGGSADLERPGNSRPLLQAWRALDRAVDQHGQLRGAA